MKKQVKLDTSKLLGVRLSDSSAKAGEKGGTPNAAAGAKGPVAMIGAMAGTKGPVVI